MKRSDKQTRICFYLDTDVLAKIRTLAAMDDMKYQPWLNRFLRVILESIQIETEEEKKRH